MYNLNPAKILISGDFNLVDLLLCPATGITAYDFLVNNVWGNVTFWRYTAIIAIVFMIACKRKVLYYENQNKYLEIDKNIIRKAIFIFSELNLKELMNDLLHNNYYNESQFNKLKEFENYLNETENDFLSMNLKKAVGELKPMLNSMIDFLEKDFVKSTVKGVLKFKADSNQDLVDEFEFQDKTFVISSEFESKYLNFMHEVKKEFI
jgi:hypothetical protein